MKSRIGVSTLLADAINCRLTRLEFEEEIHQLYWREGEQDGLAVVLGEGELDLLIPGGDIPCQFPLHPAHLASQTLVCRHHRLGDVGPDRGQPYGQWLEHTKPYQLFL